MKIKTKELLKNDLISYLSQRESDIEYHAERIAGWDSESREEFRILKRFQKGLRELL